MRGESRFCERLIRDFGEHLARQYVMAQLHAVKQYRDLVAALGVSILIAIVVYVVMIVVTKSVTLEDMKLIPRGEKIAKLLHIK